MPIKIRKNMVEFKKLSSFQHEFIRYCLEAIDRILPHAETFDMKIENPGKSFVSWADRDRREIKIGIKTLFASCDKIIRFSVRRLSLPNGVGRISRTLDDREYRICISVMKRLESIFNDFIHWKEENLEAIRILLDETIVSGYLRTSHGLGLDISNLFDSLRKLAEQTYENKALTFGCVIDCKNVVKPKEKGLFPRDYLEKKKYCALTDGYHSIYKVSNHGSLIGFEQIDRNKNTKFGKHYYPEWCKNLAFMTDKDNVGIALTRQGDILVFDSGNLLFTYRFGHWQYWNHSHIIDLLKNSVRAQKTKPATIGKVVSLIYKVALDISYRRSGGLFIFLRGKDKLRSIVLPGDAQDDQNRAPLDREFDGALPGKNIAKIDRHLLVELASLDGAVVLNNKGHLIAYGAVLEPRKKGRVIREEGSRTKAAIGASHYGTALKISSDGALSIFKDGKKFLEI